MLIEVMRSKIRYAKITQAELYYEGSIAIDSSWMIQAGLRANEKVQIVNLNNGERIETYVIEAEAGSKTISLNGPAARRGMVGDYVHIIGYGFISSDEPMPTPKILDLGRDN